VEASALTKTQLSGLRGPSPLLRLAPDERLIALVRRGQSAAFETIVARYQVRLLAFCRHLLASREDAEDVLQEVFAAAFNAMLADQREINLRPWLYRIARNRCLNHLRRQTSIGVDSMDVHFADSGASTVEKVAGRENFRLLMADIRRLPETQRTALLLREMDALSYEQIAEAMETTVPGVKSLLVRARISLGEAAEARKLTCAEVRLELGAIAEGIGSPTAAVRRHVKDCDRCHAFRAHLRANNRVMAAMLPVGPLLLMKKLVLAKLGLTVGAGSAGATAGSSGAAAAGGASSAAGAAGAAGAVGAVGAVGATGVGGGAAGALTAGALATKAVAGLAAAALVTAGAVEVHQAPRRTRASKPAVAQRYAAPAPARVPVPTVVASTAQPTTTASQSTPSELAAAKAHAKTVLATAPVIEIAPPVQLTPVAATPPIPPTTQQVSNVSVLPPQPDPATTAPTQPGTVPAPATVGAPTATPPGTVTSQPPTPIATPPVQTPPVVQPVASGVPPTAASSAASTPTASTDPAAGTQPLTPTASTPINSPSGTTIEILGGAVVTTPSHRVGRPSAQTVTAGHHVPKRKLRNGF
jgi:RNA polymerase sigma factor (sigma-70 family)